MPQLNLALQGGGAHGAYTWGVLDRLLEEKDLDLEGISGTSAGAINASIMVSGFMHGGAEGAKEALYEFWHRVSALGNLFNPIQQTAAERAVTPWNLDWSLSYNAYDMLTRSFSPYEINPLDINPMRVMLEEVLDFDAVRACQCFKLFITATHVETGQPRVFDLSDISLDAVLASTCIPFLFQAVTIDGEDYWDGGYLGNPSLWPLFYRTQSPDILIVQINPLHRPGTPNRAYEIVNRLNEITFNSGLIAEVRAAHFVSKLIEQGKLDKSHYKDNNFHIIRSRAVTEGLNASSKVNTKWDFFQYLHALGRSAGDEWLSGHKKDIGKRSSIDVESVFLAKKWHGAKPEA